MAARQTVHAARRRTNRIAGQMYVHGNVVTKPAYEPERRVEEPVREERVSSQVRENRRSALRMNLSYVMFLALAAMLALVVCVKYVQLQSKLDSRSKNITSLQQELTSLKEENNTRYNSVMDAVNLDEIREVAQGTLGMAYPSTDQVIEYNSPSADYVKQYEDIPKDGVIASSDKHTNE